MPNLETRSENLRSPKNLSSNKDFYNQSFEMAQLLFYSGRLSNSLIYFKKAMKQFKEIKEFDSYLSCYVYVIQILNELQQLDELKSLKKEVENLCKKESVTEKPLVKAYFAYYSLYIDRDKGQVSQELNQGLKLAFDQYDKAIKSEDFLSQNELRFQIIFSLYVYSIYYMEEEDYKSCLRELDNLKSLLTDFLDTKDKLEVQVENAKLSQDRELYESLLENLNKRLSKVKMMQLGVLFIEASIQMKYFKKYGKADKILWKLYEEANKNNNIYLTPYILLYMSQCQHLLGYKKQAVLFYNLAEKNVNLERKFFLSFLEKFKKKLDMEDKPSELDNYDIIFNKTSYKVIEKRKGILDLKNQFILIDLFKMLLSNQGASYSKEKLVKELWREDYNPEVHDNKIYVTIKRLREAVELDSSKPMYICRNSRGYYFSKSAKVLLKED